MRSFFMYAFLGEVVLGWVVRNNWVRFLKIGITSSFLAGASFLGFAAFVFDRAPIDFSVLEQYDPGKPSILLDDEGKEWSRFQLDRRDPVPLKNMPQHLVNAFIAAEDWQFFKHSGISFKGIIRSTLVNLYHGRIVQGASTITQQLVKLLFFDSQRTFKRKVQEQLYSVLVERQFTKEQILETYLNHIYFGCGIYGVEAAARRFWNSSVRNLTLDQSALLAAIVRSPGHYCPLWFPLSAQQRRDIILSQMLKRNFIAQNAYQNATSKPVNLVASTVTALAPHLKETLRTRLEQIFGKQQLYSGGLRIKTTLNQKAQRLAERSFRGHVSYLKKELGPEIEGGFLSIDVKTGHIKALIGGFAFGNSQFNRALQARRQQGSVFKPVLYSAALLDGMSLLDTAVDEPLKVQQGNQLWEPKNHTLRYEGTMTLARALSYSNNIISAKTILALGPQKVVDLAEKFRIQGPLYPYPSLALGCVDSTVYEVAGMFNVFANDGIYVEPHVLQWVKDRWGKKVYRTTVAQEHVLPPRIAHKVSQVLSFGLERRRKREKQWIDSAAINKTGTTNDSRSCWFAGSTPEVTTVVYVGFDDNRSMGKNVYPVYTAYPVWLAYHKGISTKVKEFSYDPGLTRVAFNIKTGNRAPEGSGSEIFSLLV